jgi:hypothetical protein
VTRRADQEQSIAGSQPCSEVTRDGLIQKRRFLVELDDVAASCGLGKKRGRNVAARSRYSRQ